MRKSRFSEEQKVKMLREAEQSSVVSVAKKHGVSIRDDLQMASVVRRHGGRHFMNDDERPGAKEAGACRVVRRRRRALRFAALCAMAWFAVDPIVAEVAAQAPDESTPQAQPIPDFVFARLAENPVSGVTRLPVANSAQFGLPPRDRVAYGLVLAPIIPKVFNGGWSILTRVTIPAVVTVPFASDAAPPSTGRTTGFGDIGVEELGHKMIRGKKRQFYDVGLGPFVGFPSASDDFLGAGRWRLGPEIALGITARHWVTVLLARNEWSVGNRSSRPDVNQLWMNYLLFYNLPKLFYLVYEPIITADWKSQPGDRWTLPVGIGFGRHFRLPKRPRLGLTARVSGFFNAVRPDSGAKWQAIGTLVFFNPNRAVFDF